MLARRYSNAIRRFSVDRGRSIRHRSYYDEKGRKERFGDDDRSSSRGRRRGSVGRVSADEGFDNVYGRNSVLAALESDRRKMKKLCVQENLYKELKCFLTGRRIKSENRFVLTRLRDIVMQRDLRIVQKSKAALNLMTKDKPHQGLVLQASSLSLNHLKSLSDVADREALASSHSPPLWLALDEVMDPQNLGALLRTSAFLGVDGILVSAKNSAPLSPAVSKASAGALEFMTNIYGTNNMPKTLSEASESGYWRVFGASSGTASSVDVRSVTLSKPTVVVLGNEGRGLRTNVARACADGFVEIRSHANVKSDDAAASKRGRLLDSLNVSVAGGIILSHVLSTRGC